MESKARKTVIITGGTTGIGKATAIKFAENNYNVVITSRDAKKETAIKKEFTISASTGMRGISMS